MAACSSRSAWGAFASDPARRTPWLQSNPRYPSTIPKICLCSAPFALRAANLCTVQYWNAEAELESHTLALENDEITVYACEAFCLAATFAHLT